MPGRVTPLVNDFVYHIFNRGSDKRHIFLQSRDYKRFQQTINYYQYIGPKPKFSKFAKAAIKLFKPDISNKLVDILCYCLMPNHFHLLIKQLREGGISTFLSQVSNSYTKYFNLKYKRIGPLLQGKFQSVLIESDEQFIHISRYIHLNPIVSGISKNLGIYNWSSYHEYLNQPFFCNPQEILNLFPSKEKYREFLEDQIDYGRTLEVLKHTTLDLDE